MSAKKAGKSGRSHAPKAGTGRFVSISKSAKGSGTFVATTTGNGREIARETMTGRFADGIRKVAKRDHDGLVKLADR